MAYLNETGLQYFYDAIDTKITAATIQATDTNNDGNIVLSFPVVQQQQEENNN